MGFSLFWVTYMCFPNLYVYFMNILSQKNVKCCAPSPHEICEKENGSKMMKNKCAAWDAKVIAVSKIIIKETRNLIMVFFSLQCKGKPSDYSWTFQGKIFKHKSPEEKHKFQKDFFYFCRAEVPLSGSFRYLYFYSDFLSSSRLTSNHCVSASRI